jgi:hypothetical protein
LKLFNSTTFDEQLKELKTIPFEIKMLRGALSLEQTKRNNMRRDLVEGLGNFLKNFFENTEINTYETREGIVLEVPNDSVYASEANSEYISILINLSVQNLEFDAFEASEIWAEDKQIAESKHKQTTN